MNYIDKSASGDRAGKGCLLQAINLYAGQTPVADLIQIAAERSGESVGPWDAIDLTEEGTSIRHPIFDLFHRARQTPTREFVIEKIADTNPLHMQCLPHRTARDQQGFTRYVPLTEGDATSSDGVEITLRVLRVAWQEPPNIPYLGLAIKRGTFERIEAECRQFLEWLDQPFGKPGERRV